MNRSQFQNKGRDILKDAGMKSWATGDKKRTARGMIGFTDLIANGKDFTAYIEVKFGNDELRPSQIVFKELIEPLTGKHLVYQIATKLSDFHNVVELYEQSKI